MHHDKSILCKPPALRRHPLLLNARLSIAIDCLEVEELSVLVALLRYPMYFCFLFVFHLSKWYPGLLESILQWVLGAFWLCSKYHLVGCHYHDHLCLRAGGDAAWIVKVALIATSSGIKRFCCDSLRIRHR